MPIILGIACFIVVIPISIVIAAVVSVSCGMSVGGFLVLFVCLWLLMFLPVWILGARNNFGRGEGEDF